MGLASSSSLYVSVTVCPEASTTAETKVGAVMSRVELFSTVMLVSETASLPVGS